MSYIKELSQRAMNRGVHIGDFYVTSTFYSDGDRQLQITWKSHEGERKMLHRLIGLLVKITKEHE